LAANNSAHLSFFICLSRMLELKLLFLNRMKVNLWLVRLVSNQKNVLGTFEGYVSTPAPADWNRGWFCQTGDGSWQSYGLCAGDI
jgi:hypothetical protein